jgi:hypothetical protein
LFTAKFPFTFKCIPQPFFLFTPHPNALIIHIKFTTYRYFALFLCVVKNCSLKLWYNSIFCNTARQYVTVTHSNKQTRRHEQNEKVNDS